MLYAEVVTKISITTNDSQQTMGLLLVTRIEIRMRVFAHMRECGCESRYSVFAYVCACMYDTKELVKYACGPDGRIWSNI